MANIYGIPCRFSLKFSWTFFLLGIWTFFLDTGCWTSLVDLLDKFVMKWLQRSTFSVSRPYSFLFKVLMVGFRGAWTLPRSTFPKGRPYFFCFQDLDVSVQITSLGGAWRYRSWTFVPLARPFGKFATLVWRMEILVLIMRGDRCMGAWRYHNLWSCLF